MNYRDVTIFTGEKFSVPANIQRLDKKAMHGWQLRYGKWTLFSDHTNDGSGAKESLEKAMKELFNRIETHNAPTGLRREISSFKSTKLPTGISGPIPLLRKKRNLREWSFGISIPRFGKKSTTINVYIGTDNTYSTQREETALKKAIQIRKKAEEEFQLAKTNEKRSETKNIKQKK